MFTGNQITVAVEGTQIAVLTVSNPPLGYMDDTTEKELIQAISTIHANPEISVVIITGGQPDVFIRHYDTLLLEARARQMIARGLTFDTRRPVPEVGIHRIMREIEESPCTYLAAINGTTLGGGYELALACDLRIAQAGDYTIGLPEVNIGLLPGAGGTQRLTRMIGTAKALELMLMGDTLTPREAKSYGLVNDVVPGPVLPVALEIGRAISRRPAKARAHIKSLVRGANSSTDSSRRAGLDSERTLFCDLLVDARSVERLQAYNNGLITIEGDATSEASD